MWLVPLGIVVHLIFFLSVFDIYFRTPIIHGMVPEAFDVQPDAKRLVLFVADGLRADSLFGLVNESTMAPFLRNIIENQGTWGISHTRVPSESRPGHVAIIGGIYEDPSAITHGWKENPVQFDSVFNQSRHTWAWGSPDILPMFASGASIGKIDTYMYSSKLQDFGSKDASVLDSWVFKSVQSFFDQAKGNDDLLNRLRMDQNVFFLHLLGIDTNGHAHKPHSKEYLENIQLVDKGIERMVQVFESFFNDSKTAFLFTSDHGMTDWGSHGAGDPSETETPLVVWGAGVNYPQDPSNFHERMLYDPRLEVWNLNHIRRHDVYQADLAPLMSSLIGIPIPVNSVGTLPVEYLAPAYDYRAGAIFANARQMLSHFRLRQKTRVDNTIPWIFKPYLNLTPDRESQLLRAIKGQIRNQDYEEAIRTSYSLIHLSMKGIEYYLNYDRPILTFAITLGFFGWIFVLVCHIIKDHSSIAEMARSSIDGRRLKRKSFVLGATILLLGTSSIFFLAAQNAPWQHYLYFLTPFCLWIALYSQLEYFKCALWVMVSTNTIWEVAIRVFIILTGIEVLVFSFFLRPLLSVGLIFIGFWPFILSSAEGTTEKSLRLVWIGSSVLLASFTYMPVVGRQSNYFLVEIGGLVSLLLLGICLFHCGGEKWALTTMPKVVFVQGGLILTSVFLVHSTAFSIRMKEGLPLGNQVASWVVLGLSFLLPMLGSQNVMGRLVAITSSLLCPFILLSIRHEVFFYVSLSIAMFLWIILEYYLSGDRVQIAGLKFCAWEAKGVGIENRCLTWSDIRIAFFFLFFIILSFFGTGNIASVNSFDPSFIYCFVTVFSPFVMGTLLLLKIVIPFLLVTCFFKAVCFLLKVPVRSLFLVFLLLSDLMALQFFFLIRTEGSWLDIGSSLSHFVISMTTTVFLMILVQIADFLTSRSLIQFGPTGRESGLLLEVLHSERQHKD